MKDRKLDYLDALKGLAILAVTMIHTGGGDLPGIVGKIGSEGARGVQMFFVISGMLTYHSLHNFFPERKSMTFKTVMRWYWKKVIRLVPMYYIAIFISMMTGSWSVYWLGTEGHVTIKNILAHIFLVHGLFPHYTDSVLGVDWYLGVLWIFILLSPIIYRFIDSFEKSVIFAVAVFILNPWLNSQLALMLPIEKDPIIYYMYAGTFGPLCQFLIYVFGIILYYCIKKLQEVEIKHRKILSYVLLLLGMILLYGQINGAESIYRLSRQEMFGLWFCIIIVSQEIHATVLINNPLFRVFGKFSYGIYLFQFIWLNFYERYIHYQGLFDWTVKYIMSIFALLGISYLLTRVCDRPIKKMCKIVE